MLDQLSFYRETRYLKPTKRRHGIVRGFAILAFCRYCEQMIRPCINGLAVERLL